MAAGRSPSGVENAYAAAVASKKNLREKKRKFNLATIRRRWKRLQCEEDEDFCPDTRVVFQGIGTESLECSEYDQDSRPAVVK
jgi:hypothetical protein